MLSLANLSRRFGGASSALGSAGLLLATTTEAAALRVLAPTPATATAAAADTAASPRPHVAASVAATLASLGDASRIGSSAPALTLPLQTLATVAAPKRKSAAAASPVAGPSGSAADAKASSQYQKLSQREHILARPEPYLGGVDAVTEPHWVLLEPAAVAALADAGAAAAAGAVTAIAPPKKVKSARELDECAIVESVITYTPALYKLFDEILVNACDNVHRAPARGQPAMSHVAVSISPSDGAVSVENDGAAIPVVMHDKEGVWVPELIFGHLLTSSNYDDSVARFTGGRHGFGAKLTNIFSRSFTVEITDAERGKRYSQTFRDNMATTEPAAITEAPTGARSSTRITFTPDLTRLLGPAAGKTLPADTVRLMRRRVFDAAACLGPRGVVVTLDGHRVPVRSFSDYLAQCPAFCGASGVGVSDDADAAAAEAADADDSATATAVEDDARRGKLTIAEVDDHWLVAVGPRYDDPLLSAAAGAGANAGAAAAAAGLRQISFVNGIATSRGGTHVAFIMDQIARHLAAYLTEGRRRKRFGLEEGTEVPLGLVRAHTSLLVSCLVPNPSFDSQTKDVLLTPLRGEGRRVALAPGASTSAAALREAVDAPALPAKLLDRIARTSGICEAVADVLRVRQAREDRKKLNAALGKGARTGRRQHLNIDKLDDANLAGTNKSSECTLILTEGDSAKALALSGLAVVGRERYGVFPLRGKLLNVRDATVTAVQRNKELTEVAEILGLRFGVDYSTAAARASLRYGRVMLMADQDHDGSHIKGLFLNIIDCFWPSLLQSNAFMQEFITPIVKATPVGGGAGGARDGGFVARTGDTAAAVAAAAAAEKPAGKGKGKVASAGVGAGGVLSFYSLPDYNKWKGSLTEEQLRRWRVKYYKGLGTSTAAEGREYFSRLGAHVISFAHDGDASAAALDLAFNKAKADDRKAWLLTEGLDEAGTELVPAVANGVMGITEFVNRELVHFSRADTVRSIPSLVDGLKPGQRKVLFACFKRNLTREIKVAQLAGYVAEHTGYHHGEQSLNSTIVNMAQDYVCSNNLPLLAPIGQFGTRHMGGKDAASPRYIFTKLQPYTRLLFRPEDDAVLTYRDDDGDSVEPFHFVPILPLVLCNGTEGIGTGFSTSVPTFHPLHIVYNLRRMLAGAEPEPMTPWAWGFKGTVSLDPANGYRVLTEGVSAVLDDGETVEITELPWGVWNANYKAFLCSLLDPKVVGASAAAADSTSPASAAAAAGFTIRGFSEHHTEDAVCFRVSLSPEAMAHVAAVGVSDAFRLTSSFLTSNMHLFDEHDKISLLDSAEDVMLAYFPVRLTLYAKRREHQLRVLQAQADRAGDRMRFIELVISGDLVLSKRKKADIVADLRRLGIRPVPKDAAKRGTGAGAADADAEADEVPIPDLPAVKGAAATATPATTATAVVAGVSSDYDYLLSMPLGSLTAERVSALAAEIASLRAQIADLTASTPATLWSRELDELERAFTQQMRMPSYEEYLLVQHQLPTPVLGKSIKGRGGVAAKAAAAAKTKTAKKTTKK